MAPLPALLKPVRPRLRPVAHRLVARRLVVLCALAWGGAAQVANADCPMELLGRWGGGSFSLAKQGDLVYIGVGPDVVVLDVADPTAPTEVGRVRLGDRIYQIVPDGDRMVVAAGAAGLWVVDIADPTQPAVLGVDADFVAKAVAVDGDRAYVMGDALYVVDLATPHAPTTLGASAETFGYTLLPRVVTVGTIAFVASYSYGLWVFDVSDSSAPTLLTRYQIPSNEGMALKENLLYMALQDGMAVFDLTDPAVPVLIGHLDENINGLRIDVNGGRAYLPSGAIAIVDVSDPREPVVAGGVNPTSELIDAVADGDLLYAAAIEGGLEVWDASNAASPVLVGSFRDTAVFREITVDGAHVVGVALDGRLVVVDASDPQAPAMVGSLSGFSPTASPDSASGRAYVCTSNRLRVVDLTIPSAPTVLGQVPLPVSPRGVAVDGTRAFVAGSGQTTLAVVDVSDPTAPIVTGAYNGDDSVWDVDAEGSLTFLGTTRSVEIIRAEEGTDPQLIGVYPPSARRVRGRGDLLFVPVSQGLDVVDISDPANPVRLSRFPGGRADAIAFAGAHVALFNNSWTDSESSITLVDVSEPAAPVLAGIGAWPAARLDATGSSLQAVDNLLFINDYEAGIYIVRFGLQSDLDLDGRVDLKDLASLLHNLGSDAGVGRPDGDLDGDGDVDVEDLQRLLTDFGQACS